MRRRLERTVVAAISSALTRETAPRDAGSDEPTLRAGVKRTAAIIVEVAGGDAIRCGDVLWPDLVPREV